MLNEFHFHHSCLKPWFNVPMQDPLRGGRDQLVEDVVSVIHADDATAREKDALTPIPERLVYEWQIKLAHRISPF
jgi:prenylcysteine alpha-carboxyl methylesterase